LVCCVAWKTLWFWEIARAGSSWWLLAPAGASGRSGVKASPLGVSAGSTTGPRSGLSVRCHLVYGLVRPDVDGKLITAGLRSVAGGGPPCRRFAVRRG